MHPVGAEDSKNEHAEHDGELDLHEEFLHLGGDIGIKRTLNVLKERSVPKSVIYRLHKNTNDGDGKEDDIADNVQDL